jgi:hypothetical protein
MTVLGIGPGIHGGLSRKMKKAARQKTIRLLPNNHGPLARRKGHAEAALIVGARLDAPR